MIVLIVSILAVLGVVFLLLGSISGMSRIEDKMYNDQLRRQKKWDEERRNHTRIE